ncbi:MAG: DUF1565 domain-containing protein, partial [Candidatus Margulisbacteria bacterium]|nr:DUF1565 domain-containing protein [Candidatus Margulisiibacteriota bacterium]
MSFRLSVVFLAVLFLVPSALAAPGNFYINASTGNDAWNGLSPVFTGGANGPWKTITHATTLGGIPAGSIFHTAAGTYNAALGEAFPINVFDKILSGESASTVVIEGPADTSEPIIELKLNATLRNCGVKSQNTSTSGSGKTTVKVTGTNVSILNNIIWKEGAGSNKGMAINFWAGSPSGTVRGNYLREHAAGVFTNTTGSVLVEKNTIKYWGNGVHYNNSGSLDVRGNIITKGACLNAILYAGGQGNGIKSEGTGTLTNSYNCLFNNETNFNNTTAGTGTIYSYPRFVDPWNSDFRLYSDSPCIGAYAGANIGADQSSGQSGSPYRDTVYVSPSGSDVTGDGSQGNSFKTIETGLKYALRVVNVAAGSYSPATSLQSLQAAITGAGRDKVFISGSNMPMVMLGSGASLSGCTVNASPSLPDPYVSLITYKAIPATVSDSTFKLTGSSTLCANVFAYESSTAVNSCLVIGGDFGFYARKGKFTMPNRRFDNTLTVEGCTIVKYDVYGIANDQDRVYVKDCIISSNPAGTAKIGSYGVINFEVITGEAYASYNDVYNNETNYYQLNTGPNPGALSEDAQFADVANDYYFLNANSPCVNAGDPNASYKPDGTRRDIGAFNYYNP